MAFHFGFGSFASFSTTGRERAFAIRDECLFCAAVKPSKEPLQTTRTRNRNPIVAHFGGFFQEIWEVSISLRHHRGRTLIFFTGGTGGVVDVALVGRPGFDVHDVADVRRQQAAQQCGVAAQHEFVVDAHLVLLPHHLSETKSRFVSIRSRLTRRKEAPGKTTSSAVFRGFSRVKWMRRLPETVLLEI